MTTSDTAATASPLTVAESSFLQNTCSHITNLLASDETWSVYLTAAQEKRVAEVDFAGLVELSQLMLDGLADLTERAPSVAELVSSQLDSALVDSLDRLRDQTAPTDLFDWLLSVSAETGSLSRYFNAAWQWIIGNIVDEREVLLGKQRLLLDNTLCDPDFRPRFKCFLVLAGIGAGATLAAAGAVATLGVGAVVGLGAVMTAGGTALAWKEGACGPDVRATLG